VPEIVLEALMNVYIIKAASNDSFYVWETLPGNSAGFNIKIFDMDNNGLNDIIMSGAQQTWIYEYSPEGVVEQKAGVSGKKMLGVYPNPSHGKIAIEFQSATVLGGPNPPQSPFTKGGQKRDYPCLKIFDASGRLLKSFNHLTSQSFNQVFWDFSDDIGRSVPAGVYFVRLESDGQEVIEKAVLLR